MITGGGAPSQRGRSTVRRQVLSYGWLLACAGAMRQSVEQEVRAVARRAGGALPLASLRALGISEDAAERAVGAGRWQRLRQGWYLPLPAPTPGLVLAGAARATLGDRRCVVTGLVPLHELGLRWQPPVRQVHLLVPDDVRRRSTPLIRITRTSGWAGLESWSRGGLRLATPARAVVDAARSASSLREARGIVLGAVADRWVTVAELQSCVDEGQRNGSGVARRAVLDARRGCASPPEAELVDALLGRGVPFLVNPELVLAGRPLGRPDVWILGTAVGGEVDSVERHEGPAGRESTYDRHERFADAGIELVHLSVARLRRDPALAARQLLGRAARSAAAPRELVVIPRGPVLR